jgi:hypothetical protein
MVLEALNDEYKARAFYRMVINTFGPIRPFVNIVEAEDTHARALERLCERYGIPLPADDWDRTLQPPASVPEACRAGVEGEIENIAMYDRFLKSTEIPDIRSLFQRLQARSRDAHLPAFQRCLARGGEAGQARGQGGPPSSRTRAGSGLRRRRGRARCSDHGRRAGGRVCGPPAREREE